jgi:putative ABC transport system substrate-binding protein
VLAAGNSLSAFALKSETTTIPIVFSVNEDPVGLGLVTSLARPGSNVGNQFFHIRIGCKRLELFRELVLSRPESNLDGPIVE